MRNKPGEERRKPLEDLLHWALVRRRLELFKVSLIRDLVHEGFD
jgi:hypothetical protein